jgi:hypothetical protein
MYCLLEYHRYKSRTDKEFQQIIGPFETAQQASAFVTEIHTINGKPYGNAYSMTSNYIVWDAVSSDTEYIYEIRPLTSATDALTSKG